MTNPLVEAAVQVFHYPAEPHQRRHSPAGYADYRWYKPWLRDDFGFRCVYCLCRERWEPNGQDVFSVEHVAPQGRNPERRDDYDNLLYACLICNSCRREEPLPFDPCAEALGVHLQTLPNGMIEARTREGHQFCDLCHLNRSLLVQFRRSLMELIDLLVRRQRPEDQRVLRHLLGFPDDLPNLGLKRPPGRNRRPEGIWSSAFERQKRGELPQIY